MNVADADGLAPKLWWCVACVAVGMAPERRQELPLVPTLDRAWADRNERQNSSAAQPPRVENVRVGEYVDLGERNPVPNQEQPGPSALHTSRQGVNNDPGTHGFPPSSRAQSMAAGGGAEGSRTPDLLIANETLYQLSYDPNQININNF